MKFGFVIPTGDARTVANLAKTAESANWDAIFVWEPVWGIDAWISLTAAAMVTERIRLGTMITPISRMRPWKLASETATLDNLSGGRVILGVGLGAVDTGFTTFGEVADRKMRAELVDEGLDILTGLWRGQPFSYSGKHYQVEETSFFPPPPPVQRPRIPIWVVGAWNWPKSMARVLRYDGLLPNVLDAEKKHQPLTPTAVAEMTAFIQAKKPNEPFDIVVEGETPGNKPDEAAEKVRQYAQAGATWWLETRWEVPRNAEALKIVEERIKQGPPAVNGVR
ncbi:LLM class flavin-dependent oxidoreductase [Candidatus Leptofilum sp.]|uniref:LLM class flavin-dependent oxidoreductase n=1 Tax=Candidatus Leptofilum sp. TaxID=3241576 RepID=UPI003B5A1519